MIDSVKFVKLLKERRYSGEELAKIFDVSRTAVWKKINKLKEEGYDIDISKDGYYITSSPDKLLPEEVKQLLKTKFIGYNYIYFDKIDSTNKYLKSDDFPDGTVVVAETQTAGKGRKGRKWISTYGKGLYFSIILKPRLEVYYTSKLSLLFLWSVFETLKNYTGNCDLKIKWPNDIYLNNKKLAGFLIDTSIENNEVVKIIVGIGINVNNDIEDFNDLDIATSLKVECGSTFDRKKLLADILHHIEKNYYNFLDTKFFDAKKVEGNLLWLREIVKIVENDNIILEGLIEGLNDDGALILKTKDKVELIYVGELSVRV
ncbi:MAG: biotin--[acetyl-CoA-carboxylase] ligase [Hydrogenothermaceae bacterium]